MKGIKFRLWDRRTETMYQDSGHFYVTADGEVMDVNTDLELSDQEYELMQFTGLYDRDGEEIYEDDVIQTEKMRYNIHGSYEGIELVYGTVKFENGQFLIKYEEGGSDAVSFGSKYHEIVGNIHEHPKLKENLYEH